jgi:hypothetical protein
VSVQALGHDGPRHVEQTPDAREGSEEGHLVNGRVVVQAQREEDGQACGDGGERCGGQAAVEAAAEDLVATLELPRAVAGREEPPHVVHEARHQRGRPLAELLDLKEAPWVETVTVERVVVAWMGVVP